MDNPITLPTLFTPSGPLASSSAVAYSFLTIAACTGYPLVEPRALFLMPVSSHASFSPSLRAQVTRQQSFMLRNRVDKSRSRSLLLLRAPSAAPAAAAREVRLQSGFNAARLHGQMLVTLVSTLFPSTARPPCSSCCSCNRGEDSIRIEHCTIAWARVAYGHYCCLFCCSYCNCKSGQDSIRVQYCAMADTRAGHCSC
eukprot:1152769-Pelagomonas_calceolata.AAC.2